MVDVRLISALEKVLPETRDLQVPEYCRDVAARGEVYSFQLAARTDEVRQLFRIETSSPLNVRVREVKSVPVMFAGSGEDPDALRNSLPGLYPDLLDDLYFGDQIRLRAGFWRCIWVTVCIGKDQTPGKYPVEIALRNTETDEVENKACFELEVKDFELAPQTLQNFHWFHADCLQDYYKVQSWSEKHWEIVENFARNAYDHGINVLYTPLWTPPLDTAVGHARPTCQLLDVTLDFSTFKYTFNFDRLRRYIAMGRSLGFERFAMSHIFTQWGAAATPRIVGNAVNTLNSIAAERYGEDRFIAEIYGDGIRQFFGWRVESTSQEYRDFLSQLMPELLKFLRSEGFNKDNCFFSLSDEPHDEHLENYTRVVEFIRPLLEEFETVEALSNIDYYRRGLVTRPVPSIGVIEKFKDEVKPLNCYYCCGPEVNAPNRFIAMPSRRTRFFGILAYIYDISLFLHWGYNFYFSQYSWRLIDPFATTDADAAFPAGDAFLVYPGRNGEPLDSIRNEMFAAGLQDLRACRTLEKKIGREKVIELLNAGAERPLKMMDFPASDQFLFDKRRAVYEAICAE